MYMWQADSCVAEADVARFNMMADTNEQAVTTLLAATDRVI